MAITMARATIAQRTQLVLETAYGTLPATPAWQRLPTLAFKPNAENEAKAYREQGRKFSSVVVPNKEWSSASFDGALTYSELPFIFCSLFGLPSGYPYTAGGTDGDVTYTMQPSNDTPDAPASFTMQHGDNGANGIQAGGMVVTDATLDITRAEAKLSGTMLGRQWTTGQTLAVSGAPAGATVTDVENIPVTPGAITAYLDPTYGALGTTKLARFLSFQMQITGRWMPEWIIDASAPSYQQLVEAAPSATGTIKVEADSQGMGLFTQYRAGTIMYIRVSTGGSLVGIGGSGPVLGASHKYNMVFDLPCEVKKLGEYSDEGGVYAFSFEVEPIADTTAGFPMRLTTTSKQAII